MGLAKFTRKRRKKRRKREYGQVHFQDGANLAFESRPAQWATLDELLEKLMFLAVSGDGMPE